MRTYRVVTLYQGAELAEGFGNTIHAATMDSLEQVSEMYNNLSLTHEVYIEDMGHEDTGRDEWKLDPIG